MELGSQVELILDQDTNLSIESILFTQLCLGLASPAKSDYKLGVVDGSTSMELFFPLDPFNTFGRIGTTCNDDWLYATFTGDPAYPHDLFDPDASGGAENCKPEGDSEISCAYYHCGVQCLLGSCKEVHWVMTWKRILYTKSLADKYRYLPFGQQPKKGVDIAPWVKDLEHLQVLSS